MDSRIAATLQQMTLEEKAALCTGYSAWRTTPVERISLPSITVTDGPHGVRHSSDIDSMIAESLPATCYPVAAALSSSWDVELLHELGQALAEECIALGTDILLGPGINMKRSPLCGRNFEYFSEDPVLAGEMAAALINGVQSKGVGTSLKHFAVNNQESRRFTVNAVIDQRTLHEIYLRGFEIAIKKAQPWTVMCAYNSVNGTFCAENSYLLTDVLRDQWQFEGFVVSDWGAVHDRVEAIRAGLELEMPGASPHRVKAVIEAVRSGQLAESTLDQAVERLLKIIFRANQTPKGGKSVAVDKQHQLARRLAADCMVLLKNENQLLPLKGSEQLAVIGQAATKPVYQGGGSSHVNSTRVDAPLDLLKERAEIQYVVGDGVVNSIDPAQIAEAVQVARSADVAVLFIALPASIESEGYDRPHLNLTAQQVALIQAVGKANPRTVVVLNNGSAIDMRDWIGDVGAVLEAWLPGQAGAGAIMDVLYGEVNPSGKLGETFPLSLNDTPARLNFPGEQDEVRYGEGIFIGYRAYEALERPVLFPFGYGLSYTQFAYSHLQVSAAQFGRGQTLQVALDVTNTGNVAGKEIVQVYVHDVKSRLPRPRKELKAFAKVALQPGETRRVTMELDERAFAYYHPVHAKWVVEAGEFDILVGSSSADIHLNTRVTLTESTPLPSVLHANSPLIDWMEDPHGAPFVEHIVAGLRGSPDGAALGVEMLTFFKDLPITVILSFQPEAREHSPQEIVESWLAQIRGN